jgi:LuxR family maltose regulon positive regulatory protein
VRRWIDAFPRSYVLGSGPLCLMGAAAASGLGEAETTTAWLGFAERAARDGADQRLLDGIAALDALTANAVDDDKLAAAAHAHASLPPGAWHALSAVGYGQLRFAAGDRDRAIELFAEAAAEAQVARAITLEVHSRSSLAVAHWEAGDSRRATRSARHARAIVREHRFEDLPTLFLATAMSALVEAVAGNLSLARADIALTRRNLAFVSSVSTWANLQARFALARASLLLGERIGAATLADEAEALLRAAPTLVTPREQLEGIVDQLRVTRTALPSGPSSLTTAELRVLHYLRTNLTLAEIAARLYISRNTAKSHTASVYRKLGARTRSEAVAIARSVGLLTFGLVDAEAP